MTFTHETAVAAVRALARVSRVLERSSPELNLAHYRVLSAVAAGDGRASRVAVRLRLGRPAVSAAVDSLCERGLLRRESVDADQRMAALTVTTAGAVLLAAVEAEMIHRITSLCDRTADGAAVLRALSMLGLALDCEAEERLPAVARTRG